jgi:HlyD family secretion protein
VAKLKKKKLFKWIIIGIAVLVVVGGGITALAVYNNIKDSDSTTTLTKSTVQSTTLTTTVSGSGSVSNSDQYTLTAAGSGVIDTLNVKQGDTVTAGEVIAHINGTTAADNVLQKQSSLDNAKSNLTTANNQLTSLYIKAPIAGRVKSIVPSAGDDIATAKAVSSNLAVISTSRSMTVSINSPQQAVSAGTTVNVYNSSGTLIAAGTVASGSSSTSSGATGNNAASSGSITVTIDTDTPAVNTAVTVKTTTGTVIGTGNLQLEAFVAITTQSNGTISNVYVTENQMVSKSTNLFKLDDTSVSNQIAQAEKAVKLAEDDLANANTALDELTIKSPIAGTIAQLSVKKGDNAGNGSTIATIINPDLMQTVVSVDELDISSVKIGQKASITLDALTKTFSGAVTAIDEIGTSSNGVATYNVTVSIENPTNVKVGMTTNAEITTSSISDVIVVPTAAVLNKSGTTGYVLSSSMLGANVSSATLKNADIDALAKKYGKKVTIGSSTSNQYQISSGLSVGDTYCIAVTVSKSAVKSLTNTTSAATAFGGMGGGMGGGMPTGSRPSGNFGGGN